MNLIVSGDFLCTDLKAESSTYVIESINWSKAGLYECHATNGVPPIAQAAIKVDVLCTSNLTMICYFH